MKTLRFLCAALMLVLPQAVMAQATFAPGTQLKASDLNTAFAAMQTALEAIIQAGYPPQFGPTSSRPTAPALGQSYFNTTTGLLEHWSGAAWIADPTTQPAPPAKVVIPSTPMNVQASAAQLGGNVMLHVAYDASTTGTAPKYAVQTAPCDTTNFITFQTTDAPTAAFIPEPPALCVAVRVIASNDAGAIASATLKVTTPNVLPGVAVLSNSEPTDTSVKLTWMIPIGGNLAFTPQEQSGTAWNALYVPIGANGAVGSTMSYTVTGLAAETSYAFRISSANTAGATPSTVVTVKTAAAPVVAAGVPTGLSVASITSTNGVATWTPPALGSTPLDYEADIRIGSSGAWTPVTGLPSSTYTFSGLAPNTPYEAQVKAHNSLGYSAATGAVAFTTLTGVPASSGSCTGSQTAGGADPILTGPSGCAVVSSGTISIPGVSISDPAVTYCCGQLNITTTYGVVSMSRNGTPIAGSGTTSWHDNGDLAQVNADLGTLFFTTPSQSGSLSDTVSLQWYGPDGATNTLNIPITVGSSSPPVQGGGGGPPGGGGGGDTTGITAARAQDVWGGFGIDTHLDGCCNGDGGHDYNDTQGVISAINYIGNVKLLRDYWEADSLNTLGAQVAAQTGAKWATSVSEGAATSGFSRELARMRSFQASCGCVWAYEGGNEWDSSYSATTAPNLNGTQRLQAAAADQPTLFAAATADGVKALQFTTGVIYPDDSSGYRCCGEVGNADYANAHTYPSGASEMFGEYNGSLDWADEEAHRLTPGKPVAHTEFGWIIGGSGFGLQTLANQAVYTSEYIFDAYRHGDIAEFYYGLYDDGSGQWGLFDGGNAPRPVAVGLHNLSAILNDTASNARTFAPGTLAIAFPSLPGGQTSLSGGQYLVMEKADGVTFDIEVGNEQDLGTNGATIAVSPVAQTVNLGFTATSVKIYDPINGGTVYPSDKSSRPLAKNMDGSTDESWTNVNTFTMALPAHPVIIEIVHP